MIRNIGQAATHTPIKSNSASKNIVGNFKDMFDEVNKNQMEADTKISQMATGRNTDIPGTMISMEKAETSMKLLMAVRNKVVSTYEEMMRMQV